MVEPDCSLSTQDLRGPEQLDRVERTAGKFSRSFYLPQTVQKDGIKANYRDGILEVHVPKAEEAKPRQIAISVN